MDDFTVTVQVGPEYISAADIDGVCENPAELAVAAALEARGLRGFEVEVDPRSGVRVMDRADFSPLLDVFGHDLHRLGDWVYDWTCARPVEPVSFVLSFVDHDPTP